MSKQEKYNSILDALQKLLENKTIQSISVSEIAQAAGIGKGSSENRHALFPEGRL